MKSAVLEKLDPIGFRSGDFERPVRAASGGRGFFDVGAVVKGQSDVGPYKEVISKRIMSKSINLYLIKDQGRSQLARLKSGDYVVGREPAAAGSQSIVVESSGVSREHGLFVPIRSHWFYKDLGSTNGSWINGVKVDKGSWSLLRNGDLLQLADVAIEVVESSEPGSADVAGFGARSLVVFTRGSFQDEYPIPEYGRALVIGGAKADLKLDVDINELPSLVIEKRGDNVCAFSIANEARVFVNNRELMHPANLADRDIVSIQHYAIVFNDAKPIDQGLNVHGHQVQGQPQGHHQGASGIAGQLYDDSSSPDYSGDFQTPRAVSKSGRNLFSEVDDSRGDSGTHTRTHTNLSDRLPFGKVGIIDDFELDETVALDASEVRAKIAAYDLPSSRRSGMIQQKRTIAFDAVEDKIVLALGLLLLVALIGLVTWWLFV